MTKSGGYAAVMRRLCGRDVGGCQRDDGFERGERQFNLIANYAGAENYGGKSGSGLVDNGRKLLFHANRRAAAVNIAG